MPPLSTFERSDTVSMSIDFPMTVAKTALHSQTRKSVTFGTDDEIIQIIHISEYSDEERQMTWYNRADLRSIKNEAKRMAYMDRDLNPDVCLRGLESRTTTGARTKRQTRIDARAAVFFEQEMQEGDGYSDPDAIADIYFEYTERSQGEAQMLALRDAADVKNDNELLKLCDIDLTFPTPITEEATVVSAAA